MDQKKPKKVYVIGHKNPDTDSICSAIAYANLKNKITGEKYIAKRAGEVNGETAYVLDKFQVSVPSLLDNVHLQVKDMDIRHIEGVSGHMSIKDAWARMKDENIKTLPVTRGEKLEGLITIGDIATSYMEVYDNNILATARTQYRNIVKTLDGTLISGNEHGYFLNGKVVIAASSPDLMENFIEKDDLVILGNRYESQLCAIEMDASCLVICQGANISKTIKKMAEERDIVIIQTPAQMKMFLTRIGFGSKVVITGDATQKDLPAGTVSGLDVAVKVVKNLEGISICTLTSKDVVRHPQIGRASCRERV